MMSKNELQELCQKYTLKLPEYKLVSNTGRDHAPSFIYSVKVEWRNGEVLEERGQPASNKKDAQRSCAEVMLQRIRGMGGGAGVPAGYDPYDSPVASPSSVKGELQSVLQKNGFPLPKYSLTSSRGPAHKPMFTVELEIVGVAGTVWRGSGMGRTKKEAEAEVARRGLDFMNGHLECGPYGLQALVADNVVPRSRGVSALPPDELVNADQLIRDYLSDCMPPHFSFREGEDRKTWLCLALARLNTAGQTPHEVAAHGQGSSKEEARSEATLHLIHNKNNLFSS